MQSRIRESLIIKNIANLEQSPPLPNPPPSSSSEMAYPSFPAPPTLALDSAQTNLVGNKRHGIIMEPDPARLSDRDWLAMYSVSGDGESKGKGKSKRARKKKT
jgi:hypothetical protein